jgi:hypothetical protein
MDLSVGREIGRLSRGSERGEEGERSRRARWDGQDEMKRGVYVSVTDSRAASAQARAFGHTSMRIIPPRPDQDPLDPPSLALALSDIFPTQPLHLLPHLAIQIGRSRAVVEVDAKRSLHAASETNEVEVVLVCGTIDKGLDFVKGGGAGDVDGFYWGVEGGGGRGGRGIGCEAVGMRRGKAVGRGGCG